MAGGSAHHLAQRRHRRAERPGRGLLCARVRLGDLRGHRRGRWLRRGGAVIPDLIWHRRDRRLRRGSAVRGWARPGGGRTRIRVGCGWFGHGVFPWHVGARRSVLGDRVVSGRPERCDGEWAGTRPLADAQQGRRQLPAAAAQGGRNRAGPAAGTGGCTQAEPPAASLPVVSGGMTSGATRPGQGRPPCGLGVAGLHRVTARPGAWPGGLPSGTGIVSRDAALRASWAAAIVMTASVRMSSSGSPGKLAAGGG
jgi:hypothetical protein